MGAARNVSVVIAIIVLACLYRATNHADPAENVDLRDLHGTWTDEKGPANNSIHIYAVKAGTPPVMGLEAWDGHMDFKQFFGEKEIKATWNVGDWDPLLLNVIMPGDKYPFAVVKFVDHDHLLVRFGDDLDALSHRDALKHADTKRLTRIK